MRSTSSRCAPMELLCAQRGLILLFTLWFFSSPSVHADTPAVSATIKILIHHHVPPVRYEDNASVPPEYQVQSYELYYRSEDELLPIHLESNVISQSISYKGPPTFELYQRVPAQKPGGEDQYIPKFRCRLPLGTGQKQFLIGKNSQGPSAANLIPIPIDPTSLPPNSIYGFNLGTIRLTLAARDQRLTLLPHQGAAITLPSDSSVPYQILVAIDANDTYRLVYRRRWPAKEGYRALCIFFPTNDSLTRWNSRLIPLQPEE